MNERKLYELALSMIPNVGNVTAKQLISYCGSAKGVFETPKGKLMRIPGVGEKTAEGIRTAEVLRLAEAEFEKAEKLNVQIIHYTEKEYPEKLKHIATAPSFLYFKGNGKLNFSKVVSIVGTRKATDYGRKLTEEIVASLAPYEDLMVVSGMAYGIDIVAHRACLQEGIPTIGVLANGLDTLYPAAHKQTAAQMCEAGGGLLSENKFGTKPDAPKFPERNRIVAGMADAVIVVEAAVKGGALITANIAQSYDREVFAVPGNLGLRYSEGCNHLIRDLKAHIYTGLDALEYVMQWKEEAAVKRTPSIDLETLSTPQKQLAVLLQEGEKHIDELSFRSQLPVNQVASLLLEMEFAGLVRSLPGKRFRLG